MAVNDQGWRCSPVVQVGRRLAASLRVVVGGDGEDLGERHVPLLGPVLHVQRPDHVVVPLHQDGRRRALPPPPPPPAGETRHLLAPLLLLLSPRSICSLAIARLPLRPLLLLLAFFFFVLLLVLLPPATESSRQHGRHPSIRRQSSLPYPCMQPLSGREGGREAHPPSAGVLRGWGAAWR